MRQGPAGKVIFDKRFGPHTKMQMRWWRFEDLRKLQQATRRRYNAVYLINGFALMRGFD